MNPGNQDKKLQGRPCSLTEQIGETMQLLSGKWKLRIVTYLLENGSARFSSLQRGIAPISPRVLSAELQELQDSHIVSRAKQDRLIAVDYKLTSIGRELAPVIESVTAWGAAHKDHIQAIFHD